MRWKTQKVYIIIQAQEFHKKKIDEMVKWQEMNLYSVHMTNINCKFYDFIIHQKLFVI